MSAHGRLGGVDQATGRSELRWHQASLPVIAVRLVVAAAASLGSWGLAVPSAQAGGQVLAAGQVVEMRGPGVMALRPVLDGRLYGDNTDVDITGIGFGPAAGAASDATLVTAAPGDELVFVASVGTQVGDGDGAPTETVVSGTTRAVLPHDVNEAPAAGASGALSYDWAVAVPKAAPAAMVLDDNGFTQTFDLRAGRRTGTQPVALYRNTSDVTDTSIGVSPNVSFQLTATGDPSGPVTIPITLTGVSLDYFPPSTLDQPPPPADKAWLTVDLTVPSNEYGYGDGTNDTFAAQYDPTLRLPGGATVTGVTGPDSDNNSPLTGQYEFEVPGDLTAATLVVAPGTVAATDANGNPVTLSFAPQTATVALPAPPLVAQGFASGHTAPPGRTQSKPGGSNTGPVVALVLVVLVVGLAVGGVLLRRRARRWLPAIPVRQPTQTALLAGAGPAGVPAGWMPPGLPLPTPQLTAGPATEDGMGQTEQPSGQLDAAADPGAGAEAGPALVVRVLGPLQVEGLTRRVTRTQVRRLLVLLALADRPLDVTALRDGLPDSPDRPPGEATVHSSASRLRVSTPDGVLPALGAGAGGYRLDLDRVEVDGRLFVELTRRAESLEGAARLDVLNAALRLVRGPVLAGDTWQGVDDAVRHLERAIETTTVDAARLALELRDARSAEAAVTAGLRALPDLPVLWELRLVAAAGGSGIGLHRAWQQTQATLGPDASTLVPTYQRLAAGQF